MTEYHERQLVDQYGLQNIIHVGVATIRRLRVAGLIPYYKIGNLLRFDPTEVIEACRVDKLPYCVHNSAKTLVARCKHAEDAAGILGLYDNGATIRVRGRTVYTEGEDGRAAESYDEVASLVLDRLDPE